MIDRKIEVTTRTTAVTVIAMRVMERKTKQSEIKKNSNIILVVRRQNNSMQDDKGNERMQIHSNH